MAGQFKQYKLVPINIFQDLMVDKKTKESNVSHCGDSGTRSIADIQQKAMMTMSDKPNEISEGSGRNKPKTQLQWIYGDDSKLPEYSKQNKIANSFEEYKDILNADIPDPMKIKLMHIFKDRYDNYRKEKHFDEDTYDSDDYMDLDDDILDRQLREEKARKHAIYEILMKVPASKLKTVKGLADDLLKSTDQINWNSRGVITKPLKYKDTPHLNIAKLLNIISSKAQGTPAEMAIVKDIIKSIYKNMKLTNVKNKELESYIASLESDDRRRQSGSTRVMRKQGRWQKL